MSHLDSTAADKKSIGFDFQDLVLIHKLLWLEEGGRVGLEIYDDIHVESIMDGISLIQVKHSLLGGNVAERDIDLWKTLYNWYKAIPELPEGKAISFVLYTNKGLGNQSFIDLLKSPKINKDAIISSIKEILADIKEKDLKKKGDKGKDFSPNKILKYVQELASANPKDIHYILDRFEFHADQGSIIGLINSRLEFFAIPIERIDDARNHLIGAFETFKFETIKESKKVEIDYETFRIEMGFNRILRLACQLEADFDLYYERYGELDTTELSFLNSTFSEQLSDLGVSTVDIFDHGIEMVVTENLLAELKKGGTFSDAENRRIETQATLAWKSVHKSTHQDIDADEALHIQAAKTCYQQSLGKSLSLNRHALPEEVCKGKFIKLSDAPSIGWRKDWEKRYKK
ncbi:hypothetical protein P3T23_004405 [Paraburkholderia sp. GAS448]|uniref:hypothetical protein n=1 Tax=Paraburkholderia sp. GAS448 TaxID=3035136 RepID=UPI003D1FA3C3